MSLNIGFRSISALTTLLALIAGFSVYSAPARATGLPSDVTLTVHYNRGDADYSNWQIYSWKNFDSSGTDVSNGRTTVSSVDAFGGIYTVKASNMSAFDNLGFLVVQGATSWSKDPSIDRTVSDFPSGVAEIWLLSGDPNVYLSQPDLPPPAISGATLTGFRTLHLNVSPPMAVPNTATGGFSITEGVNDIPVKLALALNARDGKASSFDLTFYSNIDITKPYTVAHDGYTPSVVTATGLYDSKDFADAFNYSGNDLGNTYHDSSSTDFRVWAPTATAVSIMFHATAAETRSQGTERSMTKSEKGTWVYHFAGDANRLIYDYKIFVNGMVNYASDPYARSSTIDSGHSVVVDLNQSNPSGWSATQSPKVASSSTDASIYELNVRDLSSNSNSGIPAPHQKKFLGLTDLNTSYQYQETKHTTVNGKDVATVTDSSVPTGLSAIKDLGVTHVELLPVYDFNNIAEGGSESDPPFNWGYDPVNLNVPEGGYSSDPTNPYSRITELKSAIQSIHQQGMRGIMDVVYNHVSDASTFSEEQIVPGYFFRHNADGSLTSASGCGNDIDSERPMVRKFIVDSVAYWAKEYHFDGFRFDLMGLLDVTTVKQIRSQLDLIDPSILVLGEGWVMGSATNPANQRAAASLPNVSFFNDNIRDAVKGSVFTANDKGFVQGNKNTVTNVLAGILGQTKAGRQYSSSWTSAAPGQSVNYVEAHDNLTLWDKLQSSMDVGDLAGQLAADRQAAAIVFTAQGIPFMQAGQEFLRTKQKDPNSYASSDSVNGLNWADRGVNASTVAYYKGLIALRKAHSAFRMKSSSAISRNIKISFSSKNVINEWLNGTAAGDSWKQIVVLHNSNSSAVAITLPAKTNWYVVVNGSAAGVTTLSTLKKASKIVVPAMTSLVLHN